MKQYIFLTNQYLPKPGATGMCVHNVATELAKRGESVATVCYSFDRNYHVQVIDDVKVFYIPTPVYTVICVSNKSSINSSKISPH